MCVCVCVCKLAYVWCTSRCTHTYWTINLSVAMQLLAFSCVIMWSENTLHNVTHFRNSFAWLLPLLFSLQFLKNVNKTLASYSFVFAIENEPTYTSHTNNLCTERLQPSSTYNYEVYWEIYITFLIAKYTANDHRVHMKMVYTETQLNPNSN